MKRFASAIWHGGLKNGIGIISTESGVLKQAPYSLSARFEGLPGTNPEELLAAAHAGSFSMTLAVELDKAGLAHENIRTAAGLIAEQLEDGWTVTQIHLDVIVEIPNADEAKFKAAVNAAKDGCPISRLFKTKITLDAKLDNSKNIEKKSARESAAILLGQRVVPLSLQEEYEYSVSSDSAR
jgi:osmotically inducible protein OsmC